MQGVIEPGHDRGGLVEVGDGDDLATADRLLREGAEPGGEQRERRLVTRDQFERAGIVGEQHGGARCAEGAAGARDEGCGQLVSGGRDVERTRRVLEHSHARLGCLGAAPREQQLPLVVLALRRIEDDDADATGRAVRRRSRRPH